MLANFHTHTTFCDGKNTAEEVILSAIEKGFSSIGFSGHGYTEFDLSYCMQDTKGYIATVKQLKEKYKKEIQVYLGVEEDLICEVDRSEFDYIIGSSHYVNIGGKYYPVDLDGPTLEKCLESFDNDAVKLADAYYSCFCEYILRRKPEIVGHFDLITKFDEQGSPRFLGNAEYHKLAEKYLVEALKSDCIFEVNTGAISRGHRTTPYPDEKLLYILRKHNGKIILSSDSHEAQTLNFNFVETRKFLKDLGFEYVYVIDRNEFKKDLL